MMRMDHLSELGKPGYSHRRGAAGCGIIGALFMGTIFAVVGGCFMWFWGWPVLQMAKASQDWPSTNGSVLSSEVVSNRDNDGDTSYRPQIEYSYQVDGQDYQQGNIRYDGDWGSSNSSYAHKTVREYPIGKQVDIYYDPENVTEAVLEPGVTWASYSILGFGLIFFLVGSVILLGAGGSLLFAMFIAGGAASGLIGKSPTQTGNQNKNEYSDDWDNNNQNDSTRNDDHDDGFENL
ncbi:MAG: DUF3592 domain-containing protein [Planctomycetaceae bacterium]|nr:DUF3592 domain-containing protein [Planctomycetaceae bacterium]